MRKYSLADSVSCASRIPRKTKKAESRNANLRFGRRIPRYSGRKQATVKNATAPTAFIAVIFHSHEEGINAPANAQ